MERERERERDVYFEDAGQEIGQKRSEAVPKSDGEVDEQHEVAVADVRGVLQILRRLYEARHELRESVLPLSQEDFAQPLCCAGTIDGAGFALEGLEKPGQQLSQHVVPHTLDLSVCVCVCVLVSVCMCIS